MKKTLIALLTLALLLSLAACGGPASDPQMPEEAPPVSNETDQSGQPDQQPEADPDPAPDPDPVDPEETGPAMEPSEEAPSSGEPEPPASDKDAESPSKDTSVPEDTTPGEKVTETGSETSSQPAPDPEPEPAPEPEPEPADLKAIALSLIGRPVSELYDAIGQPLSADYSPSCLDLDSDDGELTYNGFVVYTEGAPDNETVYDVA